MLNIARLLRPSTTVPLIAISILSSILFAITYISLSGLHSSLAQAALGGSRDTVVIYSITASTPFTSIVPTSIAEKLLLVNGVEAIEKEIIVPATIGGKPVIIRGVEPEVFPALASFRIYRGVWIEREDVGSAVVGSRIASHLGIQVGNTLLVKPSLSSTIYPLRVVGIIESGSYLDDEVITSIETARAMRGLGEGYVSLIRVKYDPKMIDPSDLFRILGIEARRGVAPLSDLLRSGAVIRVGITPGVVDIASPGDLIDRYLGQYGLTYSNIVALAVAIFMLTSYTIAISSNTMVRQNEESLSILRALGIPDWRLKAYVAMIVAPIAGISSAAGIYIGAFIIGMATDIQDLRLLTYTVQTRIDLWAMVIASSISSTAAALGVILARVGMPR